MNILWWILSESSYKNAIQWKYDMVKFSGQNSLEFTKPVLSVTSLSDGMQVSVNGFVFVSTSAMPFQKVLIKQL